MNPSKTISFGWGPEQDSPREECGVVGIFAENAARLAFFALFALQHRGQESAGIAVSDGIEIHMEKGMGLVTQVFNEEVLERLPGSIAVGHTRYSTTGRSALRNAQPIACASSVGELAVAHNGNLINAAELRAKLEAAGQTFSSTGDSEVIARLVAASLGSNLAQAVVEALAQVKGAFSGAILTPSALVGFRDPYGIRPLVIGRVADGWMLASETCAFGPVGGQPIREIEPGEVVIIDAHGVRSSQKLRAEREALCLFELIYFARPDSLMAGTTVYAARERMGARLAREHPVEADVVVPVPDSGTPAALGYSRASGIPFAEAMIKNRYIHRTFIQPDQRMRELGVRMKLTPIVEHVRGRRLVLVDDSIVRATTCKQIVRLLREAGAREIHVRITAPPIVHPCFYGIDMSSRGELVAARHSVSEICDLLGADSLGYLSIEGAVEAVGRPASSFCLACFDGRYPVPVEGARDKFAFEGPEVGELTTVRLSEFPPARDWPASPLERSD